MAYDVMIASAMADKTKADLVAKRLRALKFKVRYDAKREHTTPSSRDINDANKSGAVLVLWSKTAADKASPDNEWVEAIAHLARARKDALFQADLDSATPNEPFDKDERFRISGMGPKRIPAGFHALVDALGAAQGRKDLSDFLKIAAGDTAAKDAWKKAHPKDPIAGTAKKKAPAKKPTAKKQAAKKPTAKTPAAQPAPEPEKPVEETAPDTEAAAVPAATSELASEETLTPKIKLNPPRSPSAMPYRRPSPASLVDEEREDIGWTIIGPVLGGIALMMILAWVFRSGQAGTGGADEARLRAIGNAGLPALVEACPPGQVPRSLIEIPPLRTGTIVDDTEEETPEDE